MELWVDVLEFGVVSSSYAPLNLQHEAAQATDDGHDLHEDSAVVVPFLLPHHAA